MSGNPEKSLFEYDNYREFLRDFYASSKAQDPAFSFRSFSKAAGFSSPSVLVRIINGQRNLSVAGIAKFIKALKFNKSESVFFKNLVLFNQARTSEEKQQHASLLMKSRKYRSFHPLGETQYNYFAHWYFVPVRELVGLPGFKEDLDWIARQIHPPIQPREAAWALEELQRLGLLERGPQGRLVQSKNVLTTQDSITSSSLVSYHKEMLKRASESIDRFARNERELLAVTLRLNQESLPRFKELIRSFGNEIASTASAEEDKNQLYHFGLQFFPVSKRTEGGE